MNNRVAYWDAKPELNWPLTAGPGLWDRRECVRSVAKLLNKPRVLEIGVDAADVVKFCHDVFGTYTGVDMKVRKEAKELAGLTCVHAVLESPSVAFWKSLKKTDLFDLIYVDGDHSQLGAHLDITQAMLRLAPGGYILAHDMGQYNEEYNTIEDTGPAWAYNRVCNVPGWYSRILEGHGEGMGIFFREGE